MDDTASCSVLPANVLELRGEPFFEWIQKTFSETLSEVFKIQLIDSTLVLMNCLDPFDVFKYNSPDVNRLRDKVYFKTNNGDYILKVGIQTNFCLLIKSLNEKREHKKDENDCVNKTIHPSISSILIRS